MKEYDVLYTLSKCPEPIRPTDLNQHVLLSQPALSRLVDRLAARGLVQRIADSRDLRTVRLVADRGRPGAAAPRRPPARPLGRARHAIGAHPGRARPADSDLRQVDSHPGPLGRKNMSNHDPKTTR